ncbi:MAG: tetratricopeptide repeat protein [Leptolyngbyaceae cyanobacterium SM1_4_3]|nr:tetratricopeptide repeat protein [Leptolyngbyaceae cyanobacterium SM1_4_3]
MLTPFPVLASPIASRSAQPHSFEMGVKALEQADYGEAIAQFTQTLQTDAQSTAALSNRCLAYLQQGDYEKAVQDCTQALRLDANNPEAYLNRGLALDRMGQFEQAIADYNQLLQRLRTIFGLTTTEDWLSLSRALTWTQLPTTNNPCNSLV